MIQTWEHALNPTNIAGREIKVTLKYAEKKAETIFEPRKICTLPAVDVRYRQRKPQTPKNA